MPHVSQHRGAGGSVWPALPHVLVEPSRAQYVMGMDQQQGKEPAGLGPPDLDRPVARKDLQRPENPELHAPASSGVTCTLETRLRGLAASSALRASSESGVAL